MIKDSANRQPTSFIQDVLMALGSKTSGIGFAKYQERFSHYSRTKRIWLRNSNGHLGLISFIIKSALKTEQIIMVYIEL